MTALEGMRVSGRLLDAQGLERTVQRLAHEVAERHPRLEGVVLAAIREGGVPVGGLIAAALATLCGRPPRLLGLDVADHRDDRPRPARPRPDAVSALDGGPLPPLDGANVVLVDDVVHTGRTLRAALDLLAARGRPAAVEPLVLVDRGQRELPLRATYVGRNYPVASRQWVEVVLEGDRPAWGAFLTEPA